MKCSSKTYTVRDDDMWMLVLSAEHIDDAPGKFDETINESKSHQIMTKMHTFSMKKYYIICAVRNINIFNMGWYEKTFPNDT